MPNDNPFSGAFRAFLLQIGEDPEREGLLKSADRFYKSLMEQCSGYYLDREATSEFTTFPNVANYKNIVVLSNIEFSSLCEYHFLPFYGIVHIGYLPLIENGSRIIGISKLGRIVEKYSKRLQDQERLTAQIVAELSESVPNRGVMVYIRSKHLCMCVRGVRKKDAQMITLHKTGLFETDQDKVQEFWNMVS